MDEALRIWGDKPQYKNRVARTSFMKGKFLVDIAAESDGDEARKGHECIEKAKALYSELAGPQTSLELTEADFDNIVMFWSR